MMSARFAIAWMAVASLAGCAVRPYGNQQTVGFSRSAKQEPLRPAAGVRRDGDVEFEVVQATLTRIRTAGVVLSECNYALKVRLKNVGTTTTDRFRRSSFQLAYGRGRTVLMSGPYGCGDNFLDPMQECLATITTQVPPSDCTPEVTLKLGDRARVPIHGGR